MRFFYAVSILSGTIIGAGLFAFPYITTQIGFKVILIYLLFLGFISACIHHFFGDLALKTKDNIRLPGFAKIHLGNWAKNIAVVSTVFGLLGAILAYVVLGGEFLSGLFQPFFGGNVSTYTFLYFGIGSIFIFFGIKAIEKIELLGIIGFILILFFILFQKWSDVDFSSVLTIGEGFQGDFFSLYGAVFFSLWGAALIPEVEETLKNQKDKLKWVIPVGIILPILIYLLFIIVVVSISGGQTSKEAIIGLYNHLDNRTIGLALIFGFLTTFTSFVALGLTLKKILWYDLGVSKNISWAIITFIPVILFLFGANNYIIIISIIGAVFLGVDAILITIMYQKYKSWKYKFLTYPIIIILLLGIIYEFNYIKDKIFNLN